MRLGAIGLAVEERAAFLLEEVAQGIVAVGEIPVGALSAGEPGEPIVGERLAPGVDPIRELGDVADGVELREEREERGN